MKNVLTNKQGKKIINRITYAIFILSQTYWLYWICISIDNFVHGINLGWMFPALANPNHIVYGFDTIEESIGMAIIVTFFSPLILIPIYQIAFLIVTLIRIIKKKKR